MIYDRAVYRLLIFTHATLCVARIPQISVSFLIRYIKISISVCIASVCMQQLLAHHTRQICRIIFYTFVGHIGSRKYTK